ncbi:MAG: Arm DNA-binding domain-containing protein [Nocardioidaceae bacterium]
MRGSVFYHQARGRWNVEIDYGYVGGRRKRTRRSFKSRKDAIMWLTSAMKAKQDGIPIADGRTRLGDFLDNWLSSVIQPSKRAAGNEGQLRGQRSACTSSPRWDIIDSSICAINTSRLSSMNVGQLAADARP